MPHEAYLYKDRMYVFLAYMEGGPLTQFCGWKEASEKFMKHIIGSVAQGVHALHQKNLLHRDIRPANILCRANGDIKIVDLGMSIFLCEQEAWRGSR